LKFPHHEFQKKQIEINKLVVKGKWRKNLEEYLTRRNSLKAVIQLIDARHEVQNNDIQMREWLDYNNIQVITVATKADQISKNEAIKSVQNIAKVLKTEVIGFSAKTGLNVNKILDILGDLAGKN